MKPVKINFRRIAELNWGTGGTKAYKTNRKGVYYYSCSGHGGYVCLASALTDVERANIGPYYGKVETLPVLQGPDGQIYGVNYGMVAKYGGRFKRRFLCPHGSQWIELPIYFFEEDCDWALLEKFTDIRTAGMVNQGNAHEDIINQTFERWHASKKKGA